MNQTKMKSKEKLLEKRKGAYHHEKKRRLKGPKAPRSKNAILFSINPECTMLPKSGL